MEATDKINEEELHAWLDGELAAPREATVAAYLVAHPEVARRLAAYRADGEAIRRIFGQQLDPPAARTAPWALPARPWHAAPALRRATMVAMVVGAVGL